MTATALTPGFADPSLEAQGVFRQVLNAMARPGRIHELSEDLPIAPGSLNDASFAVALTLLDFETSVWLDSALSDVSVLEGLKFHCGCPIVERADRAAFALVGNPGSMPPLNSFNLGTPEYPDRAATIIIQTEGLTGDDGWTLTGPGIKSHASFCAVGLPKQITEQLKANRLGFPNGVDLIFTHGRRLACLPRTTSLEV